MLPCGIVGFRIDIHWIACVYVDFFQTEKHDNTQGSCTWMHAFAHEPLSPLFPVHLFSRINWRTTFGLLNLMVLWLCLWVIYRVCARPFVRACACGRAATFVSGSRIWFLFFNYFASSCFGNSLYNMHSSTALWRCRPHLIKFTCRVLQTISNFGMSSKFQPG